MAMAKIQTRGFKTAVNKPLDDVMDATSIINTVYGINLLPNRIKQETCLHREMAVED